MVHPQIIYVKRDIEDDAVEQVTVEDLLKKRPLDYQGKALFPMVFPHLSKPLNAYDAEERDDIQRKLMRDADYLQMNEPMPRDQALDTVVRKWRCEEKPDDPFQRYYHKLIKESFRVSDLVIQIPNNPNRDVLQTFRLYDETWKAVRKTIWAEGFTDTILDFCGYLFLAYDEVVKDVDFKERLWKIGGYLYLSMYKVIGKGEKGYQQFYEDAMK